jgi:hypothetical protein
MTVTWQSQRQKGFDRIYKMALWDFAWSASWGRDSVPACVHFVRATTDASRRPYEHITTRNPRDPTRLTVYIL